jgi:hypothetical protein
MIQSPFVIRPRNLSASTQAGFGVARVLWSLIGANMNSTADQAFTKIGTFNEWLAPNGAVNIVGRNSSSASAVGGIYSAASKGGFAVLAASTAYSPVTGVGVWTTASLAAGRQVGVSSLFLSLTTPHGSAATADFHIFGIPLN